MTVRPERTAALSPNQKGEKKSKPPVSQVSGHALEPSPRLTRVKGHAHDRGLPGAVGPQQGRDLASVEGEGQVSDGRLVALVFLGHRHQDDAPCRLGLSVRWQGP